MWSIFKGPALATLAMLMFSAMGVLVKIAGESIPPAETVLFRALLSGLMVAAMAKRDGVSLKGNRTRLLFVRGTMGAAALFLLFFALTKISVGSAILLNQTTPIFMMPMAALFLKERITATHIVLAAIAALGVSLVVKPSASMEIWPALMALGSAVFAAIAYILIRKLSATEHPLTIVFWFNLVSTLVAIPAALPGFQMPTFETWFVLLGVALFATFGQVLMTHAYRITEAGKLAVVGSTGAIFGAVFDYLLWDHIPDLMTGLGGIVVIVCCTLMQMIGTRPKRSS